MKTFTLLLTVLLAMPVWAKPVKTEDQAVDLVMKSVEKNQSLLLSGMKLSCVFFMANGEDEMYYNVDIREKHDEQCGGDPETAPRMFSYMVNKKTGGLKTDGIAFGHYNVGEFYVPIDCKKCKIEVHH